MSDHDHVAECIKWASQNGYCFAERAAVDHACTTGKQPVWVDNGLYADYIDFRAIDMKAGGWHNRDNVHKADISRVIRLDWKGDPTAN